MPNSEDEPILYSASKVRADPNGVAQDMMERLRAQAKADEAYEARSHRPRPRSNWDLYKMNVHSIFTEEYESYFNSDGSYRPRDEDGFPIPPTEDEREAEQAAKSPEQLIEEANRLAERQRRNAERLRQKPS